MLYVLIVLTFGGQAASAISVDFFSKEACEFAANSVRTAKTFPSYYTISTGCFPKGVPDTDSEIRKLMRPK